MRILLVDDEKMALAALEGEVRKALPFEAKILSFHAPLLAKEEIAKKKVDIAFLGVSASNLDGLPLAKELIRLNPVANIIFVGDSRDFAFDAFKLHASGYLLKPVTAEMIKEELGVLRFEVEHKEKKKIEAKCFGNFEVFHNGEPVRFSYKKSKEIFAYLVDREGAAININELNAVLWEEDHPSYLRNLIADIQSTLKNIGAEEVFVKRHNECYIDTKKIECDAYEYKKGNPSAIRKYHGEYMIQYSWPTFDPDRNGGY
ncbi:MAG: response regulator [Bacilli bacterium]|nr:response regulator [Bacilli bacterium]